MAASEVDIANMALGMLGASRISALDENDVAYSQYPICRDACLEEVDWSFAITRVVLATPASEAPAFGYTYRFLIPTSIVRIISVNDNEGNWEVEQGYILSDEATLNVRAVQRVTDVRQFSDAFAQALSARLAAALAIPVTNSKSVMEAMMELYARLKSEAKTADGRQGTTQKMVRRNYRKRHAL